MSVWNGHRAALSLTFDDGLTCQLDHAIPEMDKRDIRGTFFLATRCPDYPLDLNRWRKAADRHEIGSHSVSHRKAAELNRRECFDEALHSREYLELYLRTVCTSFCYPYTDAPDLLRRAVKTHYAQARGGRVAREDKYVTPGDGVNLHNVPCYHVSGGTVFRDGEIFKWLDEVVERRAWLTLMFHGVGPDETQWDNVSTAQFVQLLDAIKSRREIWAAPFGDAATCYRMASK